MNSGRPFGRYRPVIDFCASGGMWVGAGLHHRPPKRKIQSPSSPRRAAAQSCDLKQAEPRVLGLSGVCIRAEAKMSPPAVFGSRTTPARRRPASRERETRPRHFRGSAATSGDVAGRHAARKMLISERGQTARSATWQARLTSKLGTWQCPAQAHIAEG